MGRVAMKGWAVGCFERQLEGEKQIQYIHKQFIRPALFIYLAVSFKTNLNFS